ncbi:hypothetical protein ACHAWF_010831 [Thalassiosira exigua]
MHHDARKAVHANANVCGAARSGTRVLMLPSRSAMSSFGAEGPKSRGRPVPLGEWTVRAMEAVGGFEPISAGETDVVRTASVVASEPYLSSALKVAQSLADQLTREIEDRDSGRRRSVPAPGPDWSDRVVVYLSHGDTPDGGSQPPPPTQDPNLDSNERQSKPASLVPENDVEVIPYHSVSTAEILPAAAEERTCHWDEMQQVYSLGCVFYEILSGGEKFTGTAPWLDAGRGGESGRLDLSRQLSLVDEAGNSSDGTEESMPHRKKGPKTCGTAQSVSMEPLEIKGLPIRLCDLVGNMIDNGDLSGPEAYQRISAVRSDLQLMIDDPDRFLHDNLDRLMLDGLQLNEVVFGREGELSLLQESFNRSIAGDNELGVIVGESGIGKSVLAHRLGSYISSSGGLFLSGKFDHLQQAQPFSAISSAFHDYFHEMSTEGRSTHLEKVASEVNAKLGKDARFLLNIVPGLENVIVSESDSEGEQDQDVVAHERLHRKVQFLLCQFLDVISRCSGAPVTLFLDDVMWADPASIGVLQQYLLYGGRRIFIIGSCREEGMHKDNLFGRMLSNVDPFVRTTEVELSFLDKDTTNKILSNLLCLSPRLTRSLSDLLHHKTKGSPFHMKQLLTALVRDGLIIPSLKRRRWVWDEDRIQSRKISDDVATFLSSTLGQLPMEIQEALSTLSCFGSSSRISLVETLERQLGILLIGPLETAVEQGFLDKTDGSYCFCHDQLQEAAYNLMRVEDRCFFHYRYGVALASHSLQAQDDNMLFVAANQVNLGGPETIQDPKQAERMAQLNLEAGQRAMRMCDFSSAYSFFDNGINFLPKNHWKDSYDLSLQLFDNAGKCALVIGEFDTFPIISEQVLTFAKTFHEKLNTIYSTVLSLARRSRLKDAIERCIMVLTQLGEIPWEEESEHYSESNVKLYVEQTRIMLQGMSDRQLVEYKKMISPEKKQAMKFLARLELFFQTTKPIAQPFVTIKMVQLSIVHGMSPLSPMGFTHFAQLLARLGSFDEARRYVGIAQKLSERKAFNECGGDVVCVGTQVMCFLEPVQSLLEKHVEGQTNSQLSGDIPGLLYNSVVYVATVFWAGKPLSFCREANEQAHRLMRERWSLMMLSHLIYHEKNVLRLIGQNEYADKSIHFAEAESMLDQDVLDAIPHASMTVSFQKMYISFMFREYEEMKSNAESFFSFNLHTWTLMYNHVALTLYSGLASWWIFRRTNDSTWAARGRSAKVQMNKWAETSRHNFENKAFLLEAEEAFCNNDIKGAKSFYERAISSAKQHR